MDQCGHALTRASVCVAVFALITFIELRLPALRNVGVTMEEPSARGPGRETREPGQPGRGWPGSRGRGSVCIWKCQPGPGAGNCCSDGPALSMSRRETEEGASLLPRSPHHAPAGPRRHRQGAQGQVPFHGTASDRDSAQVPLRPSGGPRRSGVQIPGEWPIAGRGTVGSSGQRVGLRGRSLSSSLSLRHCGHCGGKRQFRGSPPCP